MSRLWGLHIFSICFIALSASVLASGDWKYGDKARWAHHYPQFCAGEKQSPINFRTAETVQDTLIKPFIIRQNNSVHDIQVTLKNDGHKLELTWSPSYIQMGIEKSNLMYTAVQLHWHWGRQSKTGSEHTVDGHSYASEGHLVFFNQRDYPDFASAQDKPNGLAVLGTFYELSTGAKGNPLFHFLEFALKNDTLIQESGSVTFTVPLASFNLIDLFLPRNVMEFYRYDGSLTTPPCYESVLWTVFRQAAPISQTQLELLRRLKFTDNTDMVDNFRPPLMVNPGNRASAPRTVYRTFAGGAGTLSRMSLAATAIFVMAGRFMIQIGC